MKTNFKKIKTGLSLIFSFSLFLLIFSGTGQALAQTKNSKLYFAVPNEPVAPLSNFTVNVFLDSVSPINALSLEVAYPKDKIKFLGSNNAQSIVNIWQTAPAVLPDGNLGITGGILNAFTGTHGLIVELSFKALDLGSVEFSFAKNNLYIADGKGTNSAAILETAGVSIANNGAKNATPASGVMGNNPNNPGVIDNTPPQLSLALTKDPINGSTLIAFQASDPESGIQQTQMRVKNWWSWSVWQEVQNPVLYPSGAWIIELRSVNSVGLTSVQSIVFKAEIFKKTFIALFMIILLLFFAIRVYNDRKLNL